MSVSCKSAGSTTGTKAATAAISRWFLSQRGSRCCKLRKDVNLTRKLSCSTFSDTRLFPTARPLIRRALMLIAKWKVGPDCGQ
jgi:hypothetical protein